MDGFSQETIENKWSLNARNQKLTGFVCCVCSFWTLGISAGFKAFLSQISDPFTVANVVQFIGNDLVAWRNQRYSHHMLGVDLFLKQVQTIMVQGTK